MSKWTSFNQMLSLGLMVLMLSHIVEGTLLEGASLSQWQTDTLWIIIVGFIFAFVLAFGVGANDVANVFGTSVGAKVVTLKQACIIATFAEIAGAVLIDTMTDPFSPELIPIVIAGFIVSFVLAFGVGANDVANSFGTSVGSKVLTLRGACILGTIFEVLGAILIGYKVSDTVRKGILDVNLYNNTEKELMLGSLAALGGSSIWNLAATALSLPISGTHTIVGATIGFTLCARGYNGVNWLTFAKIVASWFVSPILSGFFSGAIFLVVKHFILNKKDPITPGLKSLPLFYGFTVLVNVFSVVLDGPEMLKFNLIPWWGAMIVAAGLGLFAALVVQFFVVPRQRKQIAEMVSERQKNTAFIIGGSEESIEMEGLLLNKDSSRAPTPPKELALVENGILTPTTYKFDAQQNGGEYKANGGDYMPSTTISEDGSDLLTDKNSALVVPSNSMSANYSQIPLVPSNGAVKDLKELEKTEEEEEQELPEVGKMFSFLQIMTATFGSFAHGGNDVSNAIGPLIALWAIYSEGSVAQKSEPPIYILLYGGLGISVGLWVWGRKVIKTIGEDLTKVTPSSGFTIEIGAAFTVLIASKIGLPISTTHCKVGSVVFVGWAKSSKEGVDWSLFRNIVIAWIVTVPLTAGISALLMLIFRAAFL